LSFTPDISGRHFKVINLQEQHQYPAVPKGSFLCPDPESGDQLVPKTMRLLRWAPPFILSAFHARSRCIRNLCEIAMDWITCRVVTWSCAWF